MDAFSFRFWLPRRQAGGEVTNEFKIVVEDVAGWQYFPEVLNGQVVGHLAVASATVPSTSFKYVWWKRNGTTETYEMTGLMANSLRAAACAVQTLLGTENVLFNQNEFGDGSSVGAGCAACNANNTPAPGVDAVSTIHGFDESDPASLVAPLLEPEEIEFLVEAGAAGAVSLSALHGTASSQSTSADTNQMDDRLSWITQHTELLELGARDHDDVVVLPPWTSRACSTVTVNSWATATTCVGLGGGCRYTGTATDITCCQGTGGVITCTTVTRPIVRVCGGACTSPPRPTCR